jgi:DNA-binding NarL/FixJ family response regulator
VIDVLLVEDHPVVRAGLAELLSGTDDINVMGAAGNGAEAIEMLGDLRPDVVLMDLSMPVMNGTEATKRISEAHPDVRIVILTSFSDRDRILAALDAGAIGYILKDAEPDELIRAVRAAARAQSLLSPTAATAVLDDRQRRRPEHNLTGRELDVLGLLSAGLPNKRIARELGIRERPSGRT